MTLTIQTNNIPRPIIFGYELSPTEAEEFDYLKGDDLINNQFFRFKGRVYDTNEFSSILRTWGSAECFNKDMAGWDGYLSESFFSGLVVRYVCDDDAVIVGTYFS